jgi:hypothetical protein
VAEIRQKRERGAVCRMERGWPGMREEIEDKLLLLLIFLGVFI